MQKKPHRRLWLTHFFLACLNASHGNSSVINIFEDNDSTPIFNNLVIDKNTGCLFVGAINRLYQLTPDLNVTDQVVTGPVEDSFECSAIDCPNSTIKHLTDNVNKVLVIDYTTSRIITCGSVSQGMCTVRNLNNISDTVQTVKESVVANDLEASTVAFIAPGPPSPPTTKVMYIGVTFTGNSIYRSHVPAIASRSLDSQNMLNIAYEGVTSSTRVHVNSQKLEDYLINYVYGFSSETFSYFLTTQKRSATPPSPYISKMVRLCHEDKSYYSYTEIPLECTSKEQSYNLVQAGYVGKIGYDLATDLGITPQEDVLFAVFSSSESELKNKPNDQSALCVYSLKSIRRTFLQNINACFSGKGNLGLDFILPSLACARTKLQNITEDFCGMDVNTPLGGDSPIVAVPVLTFNTRLTAVTTTSTGDFTVVFVGTYNGHVKKLVVESSVKAIEYGGIVIQENSPINRDLIFDARQMHLYAMTKSRVSMVKVQDCHMYSSCLDCLAAKDPFCGWCSLENKCSSRSNCEEKETDPFYWKPYNSGMCTTIASVTPSQIQKNTTRTLELEIDNYPLLEESLFCVFSVFDEDFITNAHYRPPNGVNCTSPQTNSLPHIPPNQHYFTTKLSVKTTRGSNFVATNFTFFDCSTYTTCTQCVDSSFPCDWCLEADKCTHDTAENCKNDILVSNVKLVESGYRIGPSICPSIKGSYSESNEILVPSGVKTSIRVEVDQYDLFSTQTRFECQFNIEGSIFYVNATLLEDTINCELREFSFNSQVANVSATFSVIWGGSKSLENPHDIHLVIYRCNDMADNCGMCLSMPEKYRCGWCPTSNHCEVLDTCNQEPGKWLDQNMTCPKPQITSFWPLAGPWDGLTNITIVGINLGKKINDIYSGVTVAGLRCTPYAHLYEISRKIICRLDGLDSVDNMREGPIVVQVGGFRGESKSNYQFVNPIITGLHPRYGPKSGGTTLTIKGNYMNAGSNIQVLFEDTLPCVIINNTLTETSCATSTSDSQKVVTIKMFFDKSERDFDKQTYQYTDDPSVESVGSSAPGPNKVPKGIVSGGIKVSVSGKNFEFVQNPRLYVYYLNKSYFGDCFVLSNSNLICESPKVTPLQRNQPDPDKPIELDYGFKMDNVKDVENISMKTGFSKFMLFPDPVYTKFDKNIKFHNGDYLTLNGSNLDRACQETDVTVRIGKSYCIVTSLSRYQLNCRPPTEQLKDFSESNGLSSSPEFPDVFVIVGSSLNFSIGKLSYAQPPVHKTSDSFPGIIGLAVIGLAIIFIFAILIAFTNHYHKSSEMSRILQNMENQMDLLEIRVASECKNAFAELQTEIMDIAGDLTSGGIPFVDYHTYTMHILFPHMEDHELLQREKSGLIQQEKGICLFGQLILNKTFLLLFIRSMENNRYFSMRDRFNVASLIMVSLQNKMEYCTDILKTLLAEFIEKCMQGNCHPKLLLRRTESVVEKMLSSWFAFLLYKFLRDSAGEPLYILFKAMKHQVYKGPVDAITSKAKYSLSEDKLIRQSIDFVPMTVYVSISQHTALVNELDLSTGNIPVKVLDCDTVSQVKEKALDTIYRAMPFSKLPQTRDLIVEWRTGSSSRLILHDDDSSTVTENGWRKCNTLQHYMVPDGAYLNLVPVEQIPTNHLSLLSDIIDEYKYEMMSFAQSNCGSTNNSRTTLISDNVQTGGVEYWHLVEPHDIDAKKEGERRNNMVPEIYLTRLLGTKCTLQKFVDDLFEMIFSTAYRGSALPFAIKYMFDFLDDQAVRYGITDQEVVHTWKNNSLPLRFWVNLIKNPNFVFDIQKSNIIDSCLSVVAQIFMDSCSTSDHRLGKDSPSSKLLYAKEIPRYKDMVTRYYRDIKTMPPISDEDMNAMLAEESSIHVAEFDENWALCELYAYAKKYKEPLMVTLQEDESAQKQQLAHKLEQVYSMMMAEK